LVRHRWRRRRWDPRRGGGAPRVSDGAERVLHEAPLTVRRTARTRYGRRYWARDGSVLSAWRERPRFCRYCSDRLAAPSSVSRPPRVSPQSATIHQRNTRSSNIVRPRVEQRIRSIGAGSSTPTGGVCAQSSAPGSKQRPAELQVAAAAEFRRVIVDYLDRNVVEPQTILIEPPDGSANRSDRPVSGTVCR
jgi:hypothetical protein